MKISSLLNENPIPVKPVHSIISSSDNRISSLPNGLETLFLALEHSTVPKPASWRYVLSNVVESSPTLCAPNTCNYENLQSRKRTLEVPQPQESQKPIKIQRSQEEYCDAKRAIPSPKVHSPASTSGGSTPSTPPNSMEPAPLDDFYDELWMKHYNELKSYKEQFGHVNVTRTKSEYKPLGNWVAQQRRKMRQNKLPKWKVELLSDLGFEWDRTYYFNQMTQILSQQKDGRPTIA